MASAGTSGFAGRSFTVSSLMSDIDRQNAESADNYQVKVDVLKGADNSKGKMVQTQAQDRINSIGYQAQPSRLNLGLNIAGAVADAGYRYFKSKNESYSIG